MKAAKGVVKAVARGAKVGEDEARVVAVTAKATDDTGRVQIHRLPHRLPRLPQILLLPITPLQQRPRKLLPSPEPGQPLRVNGADALTRNRVKAATRNVAKEDGKVTTANATESVTDAPAMATADTKAVMAATVVMVVMVAETVPTMADVTAQTRAMRNRSTSPDGEGFSPKWKQNTPRLRR